jgi:hypothetical protein
MHYVPTVFVNIFPQPKQKKSEATFKSHTYSYSFGEHF